MAHRRFLVPLAATAQLIALPAAPGAVHAADALCEPLQTVIAAAEKDFASLGQLPGGSGVRKAPGSLVLPGTDSCRVHASLKSISYICEKAYPAKSEAAEALKALDAGLRACRPGLTGDEFEGIRIYEEPYPARDTYLMMDLGVDWLDGKYVLSLGIGLDN